MGSGEMNGSSMTFQVSDTTTFGRMSSHRLPFIPSPDRAVNRRLPRGRSGGQQTWGTSVSIPCGGGGQDRVSWLFHLLIADDYSGLGRVCSHTRSHVFYCGPLCMS